MAGFGSNMNIAVAISSGGGQVGQQYGGYGGQQFGGPQCVHHHHHHHDDDDRGGPKPPERNKFLDFLTAPMQALKGGGNNNDKQYDKYAAANQGGNFLKGF